MFFFPELSHLIYDPMELQDMLSCIHKFKSPEEIKYIVESYNKTSKKNDNNSSKKLQSNLSSQQRR